MEEFINSAVLSLDNDLKVLVSDRKANVNDAVQLQILRILRGKPFNVDVNLPAIVTSGWTPDGITWLPSETGTGPVK